MNKKNRAVLWLYSSAVSFIIISIVFLTILAIWITLYKLNVVEIGPINSLSNQVPVIWLILASVLVGCINGMFAAKFVIKPIADLSVTFDKLSKGDFSVKIDEKGSISPINEMAKCFNSMVNDLSHIETLQSDFVANVSHEFKTPIASIEGYAMLLQNSDLSPEIQSRYIQKIIDNSQKLSKMSSNILALSKLENQETVLKKSKYRLDEQLRKTVLLLENKWTAKNIEFEIDLPKCKYFGNEQLLEQVWYNIIDNAIKNSYENSKITITLKESEHSVTVSIADNGCGMSEEVQKHLFKKFYQADTSRTAEGNGLGLSIVKRIVDLYNGKITVISQINEGCTFKIKLPKNII